MVKFDGKHWIAKRPRKGPFLFYSYDHVAQQASRALGNNCIVAIPNARPDEYRFEKFYQSALNKGSINDVVSDGRVFYDTNHKVYFMKRRK